MGISCDSHETEHASCVVSWISEIALESNWQLMCESLKVGKQLK